MKKSFEQDQVARQVNSCFVLVLVDMDKNQRLANAIGIEGLPTTVIINSNYEVVEKITGYQSAAKLKKTLDKICREHQIVPRQPMKSAIVQTAPRVSPREIKPLPVQQTADVMPQQKKTNPVTPPPPSPFIPQELQPAKNSATGTQLESPFEKPNVAENTNPFATLEAKTVAPSPIAFKSLCLVSLLDERLISEGSPEITSTFRGKRVCFTSTAAKQKFDAKPERYWPLLDGRCMMSHLENGVNKPGNPEMGAVYKGKLWFFSSTELRQKFADSPKHYASYLK